MAAFLRTIYICICMYGISGSASISLWKEINDPPEALGRCSHLLSGETLGVTARGNLDHGGPLLQVVSSQITPLSHSDHSPHWDQGRASAKNFWKCLSPSQERAHVPTLPWGGCPKRVQHICLPAQHPSRTGSPANKTRTP